MNQIIGCGIDTSEVSRPNAQVAADTRLRPSGERERIGRFSEGLEQLSETPSKLRQGRFSDDIDDRLATPGKRHRGRFSEGIEQRAETAATVRRGSFADGCADIPASRFNAV